MLKNNDKVRGFMKKIGAFIAMTVSLLCVLTVSTSATDQNLIKGGDFESGIADFGIAYSSRQDTVMPSIFKSTTTVSGGEASLEMVAGDALVKKTSDSAASVGFAYQGIYSRSTFAASANGKYTASADIYTESANVKARFVIMNGDRTVAASDEIALTPNSQNSVYWAWYANSAVASGRLRLAFYNFDKGDSIYIDNLALKPSVTNTLKWTSYSGDTVTVSGANVAYSGKASGGGILGVIDKSIFTTGNKYFISGRLTAGDKKAYANISAGDKATLKKSFAIGVGEDIKFAIPFLPEDIDGDKLEIKIEVTGSQNGGTATLTLKDFEITAEENNIEIEEKNDKIYFKGKLRSGNGNKIITVSLTDYSDFVVTTNASGEYSFDKPSYSFDEAYKYIEVRIKGINGYADTNNEIVGGYTIINETKRNSLLSQIAQKTSGSEINALLGRDELFLLEVLRIPSFASAKAEDAYTYIIGKDISTHEKFLSELTLGCIFSTLNERNIGLSTALAQYADELNPSSMKCYSAYGAKITDKDYFDNIFKQSQTAVSDFTSFEYALSETIVKYLVDKSVNYSAAMEILENCADKLNVDLSGYNAVSPEESKKTAANDIVAAIKEMKNFSALQSKIDGIISAVNTPVNGGYTNPGSGGGGGKSYKNVEIKIDASSAAQYKFSDLGDYAWAEEGIYALLEKNVISQNDEKLFRPSENITRAEFAKMIAVLADLAGNASADTAFSDVPADAWYYAYVMNLRQAGIINGITDNYFGANEPITRQDICTITVRWKKLGTGNSAAVFTDMDDVRDYARDAVRAMYENGYISGYEDGSFKPLSYATRAEVAKMLGSIK